MTPPAVEVTSSAEADITEPVRVEILALDSAAETLDGASALDDQVRLDLATPSVNVGHLVARRPGNPTVIGYGHTDSRAGDAVSGHLLVGPQQRRHGVGTALLEAMVDMVGQLPLRVWAHGNTPSAQAFARARGFAPVRELRKMRRSLAEEIAAPSYDPQTQIRTFVPGRDEEAWVAVNAASFSHHPEQGRMTVDDLRQRIEQPWFDPAGFFLAERGGRLVGFHWTKVHPVDGAGGGPVGEVYVLGVHPDAQGLGLGKALTLTGLRHLRDAGLDEVMLYVDGDNLPAIAVYERLGFTTSAVDVMYARSAP